MARLLPQYKWGSPGTSGSRISAVARRCRHHGRLQAASIVPTVFPESFGLPGTRLSMGTTLQEHFDWLAPRPTAQISMIFRQAPNLPPGFPGAATGAILYLAREVQAEAALYGERISMGRTSRNYRRKK